MSILKNFSSSNLFMLAPQTQPKPRTNPLVGLATWCAGFCRVLPRLRRRSALDGAIEHLESLPLTAHSSLALVRFYNDTLLLGITPQSITLLSTKGHDESIFRANPDAVALREEAFSQTESGAR
jgi:flagellar biogenesis protein FliO